MKVEEVIKLIDAGYSKEEIDKMLQSEPEPKPEQNTEPKPEQNTEPKPEPKPDSEPKPEPAVDPVLKELQDLKKAVYAMNIMNSAQPEQKSVDDILAASLKEE